MEDQLRKEKRRKGQFEVVFDLRKDQREVLTLQLLSYHSHSFYQLKVDQQYLKNHSDMASLFPSPSDLLYTLKELFDMIQLTDSGMITIKVSLSAAKINMTKVYELQMEAWPEGELQWLRAQLCLQKQEEAQLIAQKQFQIESLRANIDQQKRAIAKLREDMSLGESVVQTLQRKIQDMEASIKEANHQLLLSQQVNSKAEKQIQQLRAEIQKNQSLLQRAKEDEKRSLVFQEKVTSCLHEANPQLYHFHYAYSLVGLKVIKKAENGWSNFVAGWPLFPGQSFTISFRLGRMRDGSLAIGVGSQAALGFMGLEHTDFVGYLCRDGRIYENGMKKLQGTPILPDQIVTMIITRAGPEGMINWHVGGLQIGSAVLPSHLNTKNLLIMVKVFWKDDGFQVYF